MILMAGATTMTRKKTLAVHLEIGENIFSLLFDYENLNHVNFNFNLKPFCQYLSISKVLILPRHPLSAEKLIAMGLHTGTDVEMLRFP